MRNGNLQLIGLLGLVMGLSGCKYVTTGERTNQLSCLDKDGDGAVASAALCDMEGVIDDCNDSPETGANETPGAEEIPYDGWDNDCGRLDNEAQPDLVDVDGDGYPGILRSEWEKIASSTVSWPGGLRDELDCDDNDPTVYPGAVDRPYDGVDSDCNGDDDYDRDGDGYVPNPEDIENEPGYVLYTGPKPAGDCNDFNADIHPGAEDVFYDGIDSNCDGLDDFDADGDGYASAAHKPDGEDCDDTDAEIHPGQDDVPYDGIDSNCDGLDDFDFDRDGFIPDTYAVEYSHHEEKDWYQGLPAGDCDDEDADIFPGQLEIFLDGIDQDCDGSQAAAPIVSEDYSLVGPRRPQLSNVNERLVLSIAGDSGTTPLIDTAPFAVGMLFPDELEANSRPVKDTYILTHYDNLYGEIGVAVSGNAIAWSYVSEAYANQEGNRVALRYDLVDNGEFLYQGGTSSLEESQSVGSPAVTSAVYNINGSFVAVACGKESMLHIRATPSPNGWMSVSNAALESGCDAGLLLRDGLGVYAHLNEGSTQKSYALAQSGDIVSTQPRYTLNGVTSMRTHSNMGVIGLAGTSTGALLDLGDSSLSVLEGHKVYEVDAVEKDGIYYVAALVDDPAAPELIVAEITDSGETEARIYWNEQSPLVGVTIEATANRLMVAMVSEQGDVAWAIHAL